MSLGKVAMAAGGCAKQNVSLEQGMQVPGTITLRNSVEILTKLYTYHGQPKGRGRANCRTNARFGAPNCMNPPSEYASSKAWLRTICRMGVHHPQTLLTSFGLILTA